MKIKLTLLLSLFLTVNSFAQDLKGLTGDENWFQNWTNFKPATTEYKDASIILAGTISESTTLYKKNVYRLTGTIYVTNNATLTIEPGTLLRGDSDSNGTLVITKGAKIIANGTETDPIVFTSNKAESTRKAGDWGGLVILGDAPTNKFGGVGLLDMNLDQSISTYGGADEANDSGILKYVRIEFAGRKLKTGKEFNGLTLAGVGSKTKLAFIQISFSNDDSFECLGGNVQLDNMISFKATDDDYDFTQGTQCFINNSIAMRYPYVSSDVSVSRAIEVDSYDKAENMDFSRKLTNVVAINVVLSNNEEDTMGLVKEAISVNDKSTLTFDRGIITGFSSAILIASGALNRSKDIENVNIKESIVNFCTTFFNCEDRGNVINTDVQAGTYFNNNIVSKIDNVELFRDNSVKKSPDFRLRGLSNVAFSK